MDKIEYYQKRIKELTDVINLNDSSYFSKDWIMKMLDIKNNVRKNKIKKILDGKTGEI